MNIFRFRTALILLIGLLFSFVNNSVQADDDLINDSGLWSQIEGHFDLGKLDPKLDRFLLLGTGEARFFEDFGRFTQGIIRIMPGYRYSDEIALFFGYTWVPTVLDNGQTHHEHDINQAMYWTKPQSWGSLSTRTMIEWRFVNDDSQMATRVRQRIRGKYQLSQIHPYLHLTGWEELFLNVYSVDWGPQSGFDQNRVFAGLGWQFDPGGHYWFEIGYMNQYIHHPDDKDLMNHMLLGSLQFKF